MTPDEIKELVKKYLTENLDITVFRTGYNDELIGVEISIDSEVIARDTVRIT